MSLESDCVIPLHKDYCIPNTKDLVDPAFQMEGWERVIDPQPGDLSVYKGHMGIVYSPDGYETECEKYIISASAMKYKLVGSNLDFCNGHTPVLGETC